MTRTILRWLIQSSVRPFNVEETHLSRFRLYQSMSTLRLGSQAQRVASISGSEVLCRHLGVSEKNMVRLDYPQYDARSLPFPAGHFDLCVADQVIEHVDSSPAELIVEMGRVLKPGGLFVNATVMTYPLHFGPRDLWRFTPEGQHYLLKSAGFEIIHEDSWGGNSAVAMLVLGLAACQVPRARWHPIRRLAERPGGNWPVVVWAVARRC